jgi:hypothetical protein
VPCSPEGLVGSSGDRLTDVGGMVVLSSEDVAEVEDVVVVVSDPESSPPQPVASEPAATPVANANRAEFERKLRALMPPVIPRQRGS